MNSVARLTFTIEGQSADGRRTGLVATPGWRLSTPAAVPVGPIATAGSLTAEDLAACRVEALGIDWLRLYLRPGVNTIGALGGLRRLVGWSGPLIAGPSGWAFAGTSASRVRVDAASVVSPVDGSTHRLTPEEVIEKQLELSIDLVAALDWPDSAERGVKEEAVDSMRLDWAERSLVAADGRAALLAALPIESSIDRIRAMGRLPFDGFALQGPGEVADVVALKRLLDELPAPTLRVADWVGDTAGLARVVSAGVDLVRLPGEAERARQGRVMTDGGEILLSSAGWLDDSRPIEPGCTCQACRRFSRAHVRHLYDSGELLGPRLVEAHNLTKLVSVVRTGQS